MEVVFGEMNSVEQVQVLQCGQIDLGFVYWGRLLVEIVFEFLISDLFFCCLFVGYCLVGQVCLDFVELCDEDFIFFLCYVFLYYYDLIIVCCVDVGFSLCICYEVCLWQIVVVMVGFGMGVVLILEIFCLVWWNEVCYLEIELVGVCLEIYVIFLVSEFFWVVQVFLVMLKSGLDDV